MRKRSDVLSVTGQSPSDLTLSTLHLYPHLLLSPLLLGLYMFLLVLNSHSQRPGLSMHWGTKVPYMPFPLSFGNSGCEYCSFHDMPHACIPVLSVGHKCRSFTAMYFTCHRRTWIQLSHIYRIMLEMSDSVSIHIICLYYSNRNQNRSSWFCGCCDNLAMKSEVVVQDTEVLVFLKKYLLGSSLI